jgi:PAS domain S-box-containing protein
MTIRTKTIVAIVIASAIFFAFFIIISYKLILSGFDRVENDLVNRDILRTNEALNVKIDDIATKVSDWAQWDDNYKYVQDHNKSFVASNLTNEALTALKINLIAIIDSNGNTVISKFVNLQTGQPETVPPSLLRYLDKGSFLTNLPTTKSIKKGLVELPGDDMIVASRPILTSKGQGPIKGTIIFGRYFDTNMQHNLSVVTHLGLSFNDLNDTTLSPEQKTALAQLSSTNPTFIQAQNNSIINGYTVFNSVQGKPAILETLTLTRDVHRQGLNSIYSFFVFFGGLSVVLGIVILFLLDRIVISRLDILNKNIKRIGEETSQTTPISLSGNDELSELAKEINTMVQSLQKSNQLIKQDQDKIKEEAGEVEKKNTTLQKSEETLLKVMSDLENTKDHIEKEKLQDETMLKSIGEGLIVTDNNGVVTIVNSAAQQMLKYTAQELIGKRLSDEVSITDETGTQIAKSDNILETVLKSGQRQSKVYYFLRKDGSRFPSVITTTAITLNDKIIGAISVLRDITREKEVDKMKSEFISLASHQLRSPLTAIKWFSESLLGKKQSFSQDQAEYLESIHQSNERMIELVDSLLNISRIESGRLSVYPKSVNILQLISEIQKELLMKIEEKHITITVNADPNDSVVTTDPKLVHHVYLNLLSNSVKYSPPNTSITISITKNNNFVITQIQDQGYGIPEAQQSRLFEKFFRADNIKQKETDGTGLGLYLVKIILDLLSGTIWFKSAENTGTTFWVSLPVSGPAPKEGEISLT